MNVEFDKSSLNRFQKELKRVVKEDREAVFSGMKITNSQIYNNAVENCPVDTGELKSSLKEKEEKDKMAVSVVTTCEHAPFVELGTRYMVARPFLRTAFTENIGKLVSNIRRLLK